MNGQTEKYRLPALSYVVAQADSTDTAASMPAMENVRRMRGAIYASCCVTDAPEIGS
jgi:phenolic acid decarboxylase